MLRQIARSATCLIIASSITACGARSVPGGRPDGGQSDAIATPNDFSRPWDTVFVFPDTHWPVDLPGAPTDLWIPSDLPRPVDIALPCRAQLGEVCGRDADCCGGLSCSALPVGPSVCTRSCNRDDPATPLVNEDSCPSGFSCAALLPPAGQQRCLRKCAPRHGRASCPRGLACHPATAALSASYSQPLCATAACTSPRDCPVRSAKPCSVNTPGATCAFLGAGAFCAPDEPGAIQGKCAVGGVCDLPSGLCRAHKLGKAGARVGDPCKDDRGCGGAMRCEQQSGSGAAIHARNGYCTIIGCAFSSTLVERRCPGGSTCQRLRAGGLCFRTCDLRKASSCRGNPLDRRGDYECYAFHQLYIGGQPIAGAPTCEPADRIRCDLFGRSSLTCAAIGLRQNPTQMACRDRATGKTLPPKTAGGVCLDNTASGR